MHSLSSREKTHCTLVLHMCSRPCTIALLALRSMAPFGWLNFSLPSLSHPTLSRVLVSHPEEAARFSRPILDIGNYDLLTVIGSCFWLISQTQCLTLNVAKAHMSNLIPRELFPIRHQLGRLLSVCRHYSCTVPQMIPNRKWSRHRKWSPKSTASDP